jgi:hypothetical protein
MRHRKYGGSTAHRTIACPAWHTESEGIPRSDSLFAQIGTALHSCMEEIVLEQVPLDEVEAIYPGVVVEGITITSDMARDKLRPALEAFNDLCDAYNVEEFEPEVECSYAEDIGGYADAILRGHPLGDDIYVICLDWKFGDGVQVEADDSPQAKFYGMAARKESSAQDLFAGATKFVAAIIQPNDRDMPLLRTWECDIEELDQFEKQHARSVKESKSKHPPIAAGDHCKFCPAAPVCPQKTGQALAAMQMDPENLDTLTESMDLVKELKAWIKDVERVTYEQLQAGSEVPGWKLVAKRATARWKDENAVLKAFRRRLGGARGMTKTVMLSPAQMLKLAKERGKEIDFEPFISRTSTGSTLAPEDDKRPAVLAHEALQAALKSIK